MRIIEIEALENGAHRNQTNSLNVDIPEGWAVIPDDMELPYSFPFVYVTASGSEVISLAPAPVPPPDPIVIEPSAEELINALLGVEEEDDE